MRIIILLLVLVSLVLPLTVHSEQNSGSYSKYADSQGAITLPTNYRDTWTYLGSWVNPNNSEHGFHTVYVPPGIAQQYKANGGKFPDGAVLVKEIRASKSQIMTSGRDIIHAQDIEAWFVMIKDDKGRFKGNSNWGEGWGWAKFEAKDPSKNISTDYKIDCIGCHIPAKNTDWIYTEGYPVLNKGLE